MISYAQNFEDLMLYRALRDVEQGFYIDVGAQHPSVHSVTKFFYDLGWSGINIEPVESYFRLLEIDRPRDVNLQYVIGDKPGKVTFYEVEGTGLSTVNPELLDKFSEMGFTVNEHICISHTLDSVLDQFSPNTVHFLKIDVEGFEREVLSSVTLEKYRPWVIIVEATKPTTTVPSHFDWEHILLESDYLNCYNDGLNRFYLSIEKTNLKKFFDYPPNCFDHYEKSHVVDLEILLANTTLKLKDIESSTIWRSSQRLRNLVAFIKKRFIDVDFK